MDRADKLLVSNLRYINKGLQKEIEQLRADLEAVTRDNERLREALESLRQDALEWTDLCLFCCSRDPIARRNNG